MALTVLPLTASALSDAIGGGLLEDALIGEVGGSGYTLYLDEHRVAKGLPPNGRAAVLAARLGHVNRELLADLRGDVLVLGCDGRLDDVSVPRCVVEAAARSGLTVQPVGVGRWPGPRCRGWWQGYVAVPAHANPDSAKEFLSAWRESFAAYASREGYCLGSVFTDIRGREERGLYGLAEYLRRDGVVGVVVPDVAHLMHVRALSGADWRTAQCYLHSAVLPMDATSGGPCGDR